MKGGLFLNIIIREGATILELFAGENQALLVGRDPFLVLNLGLNIIYGVGGLHFEGNSLAGQGLDEDLHPPAEAEDQMERGLLLDVTADVSTMSNIDIQTAVNLLVAQGTTIFELLPSEDKPLLVGGDPLLVLDFCLDIVDSIRGLDLEGDSLSGESFDEDLHDGLWGERL